MDFLKAQTTYIAEQFRGLSLSQRIAIGLLLVVLLAGVSQMMRWAGQADWMPLLDQPFNPDQIRRVRAELQVAGVKTKVEGDRVLIHGNEEDRQRLQAVLAQRGAMPGDTSLGYGTLIKDSSVFVSNQEARWRQNRGLEAELSAVLSRFQGISDARVFIDKPQKRGLGRTESGARASVHVTLDGDQTLHKRQVTAIANFVAGAVRGMSVADVKITDGSQHYRPPDPKSSIPSDMLDMQRDMEDHYTRKIYDQLGFIDGLVVNVHVKLRDVDERTENREVGKAEPLKETSETQETTGVATAAGPGVLPNQNRSITDTSQAPSNSREKTSVEFNPDRDTKLTHTNKPAGYPERLTASVNVPQSYIENIFRKRQGLDDSAAVEPAQVETIAAGELAKIQQQVKTLLQVESDDQVAVQAYYDSPSGIGTVSTADSAIGFVAMAKDYGPHVGLGLLALFSFLAVFRIAKRAQASVGPLKTAAESATAAAVTSLGGGPMTVGEAEGMHSAMIGHEVDEGLVRTQQIVDQIGELVNEDATSAASIVRGWLQEAR